MKEVTIIGNGLSKLCRLCLKNELKLDDIFLFSFKLDGRSAADVIMTCTPIQINKFDGLPNFICSNCYIQLVNIHQFQVQVKRSDTVLCHYLQQLRTVDKKIEHRCSVMCFENCEQKNIGCYEFNVDHSTNVDPNSDTLKSSFENNVPSIHDNYSSQETKTEHNNTDVPIKFEETDIDCLDIVCEETKIGLTDTMVTWEKTKKDLEESKMKVLVSKTQMISDRNVSNEQSSWSVSNANTNIKRASFVKQEKEIFDTKLVSTTSNDNNAEDDSSSYEKTLSHKRKPLERKYDKRPQNCDVCNKSFTKLFDLKSHKLLHAGKKQYQCGVCNKTFKCSSNLCSHKRRHTGEKPFQCNICYKTFRYSSSLHKHNVIHTEKRYVCDICGKTFTQAVNLRTHKVIHTGEKPYNCDLCNKSFSYASSLKIHTHLHTGKKPYSCDLCGKTFNSLSNLYSHKRIHTGEKLTCAVCSKAFHRKSDLASHKRTHSGEKPYKCDICYETFRRSDHLCVHKRTHTGEKPYQCDVCKKAFARLKQLKRHKPTHSTEKI